MYAIIQSGGRQLRVAPGAVVDVDHFAANAGEEVSVSNVLFVATDAGDIMAGTPFVAGAKVVAVVEARAAVQKSGCSRRSGGRACAARADTAASTHASA